MTRIEIIKALSPYFDIRELVEPEVYQKHGDFAWYFIRMEILETLLALRVDILKVPMTVNTWHRGGKYKYRGVRSNLSPEVLKKTNSKELYMSGHPLGAAVDFDAEGMTADETRKKIILNADKLPYPIRLEEGVTWVHTDTYNDGSEYKVKLFRA